MVGQTMYNMANEDSAELRSTLHKRHNVLAALATEPKTKPDLVDAIAPSRSTIDRAISALEDAGCIERRDSTYYLTQLGRVSLAEHNRHTKTVDGIARASDILDSVSTDVHIDPVFFSGVSAQTADPHAPESPLKDSIEALKTTDRLVGLVPVILSVYIEALTDLIREHDVKAELLLHENAYDSLLEHYQDQFGKIDITDHIDFYVTDQDLPYTLWITEHDESSRVDVTVHENGGMRGVLMNDTPAALQWARDEFAEYLENADPVTVDLI